MTLGSQPSVLIWSVSWQQDRNTVIFGGFSAMQGHVCLA